MLEYSLWEKIKAVFDLTLSSPLFLVLLFGIVLMLIDALYISKGSKKTKKVYALISTIIVILMLYTYIDSLAKIFDSIAKGAVNIIYFPSVLEYIITLFIGLIILIFSILNKKMTKKLKIINAIIFIINSFLFFLIIDQIAGNSEIDLTNKVSIYTNSNMMILLELSIFIFIAWIIGLTLYKIIRMLNPDEKMDETVNLNTEVNFYNEPKLPDDINTLRQEALMAEPIMQRLEDMFTLEEYRQMRELLDEIKKREMPKKKIKEDAN